jgi:hypothetical protein
MGEAHFPAANFISVVNNVEPGAAALAKVSEVGGHLSCTFDMSSLAGPVFAVAALFLRCAELVGLPKEGRAALGAV